MSFQQLHFKHPPAYKYLSYSDSNFLSDASKDKTNENWKEEKSVFMDAVGNAVKPIMCKRAAKYSLLS